MPRRFERRRFLFQASTGLVLARSVPAWASRRARARPALDAVMSGDVLGSAGVVWGHTDRPARLVVEWSTTPKLESARRVIGPAALPELGGVAQVELTGLPAGQQIFYRARFQDLRDPRVESEPRSGRLVTAPKGRVRFAFSGDQVGQGYGIDEARGGMKIFSSIAAREPQFFLHLGDRVYADQPLQPEMKMKDGSVWKNLVTPAKSKVAETLEEFRGQYRYNLLDVGYRDFLARTPMVVQWDDHETRNNWFPGRRLDDDRRYTEKSADVLAARAAQACLEFSPVRRSSVDPHRFYRSFTFGPHLEVFVLDARSYRGANSANRQKRPSSATAMLGTAQLDWLKDGLRRSRATWKVLASDLPIGLVVPDGPARQEGWGNGEGPPLGREHELADLFRSLRAHGVDNVLVLTADVHYAAAHHYAPDRASTPAALDLWEIVAGPLHAGGFGPNPLDPTFGPRVAYSNVGPGAPIGRAPDAASQTFGEVEIDPRSRALTVRLFDAAGRRLWAKTLPAATPER